MNQNIPYQYNPKNYHNMNYQNINYQNDDRLIGGFAFPFLLGGVTGAAIAPSFWRPSPYNRPYYQPYPYYYPYYR